MKKFLALAVAVVMTAALFAVAVNAAADPAIIITAEQLASESNATKSGVHFELVEEGGEKFARFTADDKDPHLYLTPDVTTDTANHYAAIKYRTTSGAATIDAYMAGAEPHTMFEAITADGQWHTTIGDLEQSGANWTGKFARLDPMNGGTLEVGDTIDIAWIALFDNEADARAYTGPSGSTAPVEPAPVKDADAWLCQAGGPVATGWWMHPFADQQWEFNAKCTSPSAFDGIIAPFYANPEGATVKINLLDENGKILETVEHTQKGDGTVTIDFSKAYPAGTYTIQILSTANGAHFVVGSSNAGEFPVEITGNCNTNDNTLVAPIIVLRGAVPPAQGGEPSNPGSGDAAIVAIAAVGCIALAGVVIAKKVK